MQCSHYQRGLLSLFVVMVMWVISVRAQANMVHIPAGQFMMGGNNNDASPSELPRHPVQLNDFYMDDTAVTNEQFAKFVNATGYITTAEKPVDWEILKLQSPPGTPKPPEEALTPGSMVFTPTLTPVALDDYRLWWHWVIGANWQHPRGPNSKIFGANHPVVQVTWYDANAYCRWQGKRLPTEAEREWAARGGLTDQIYPWGDQDIDTGPAKANTWQGEFPFDNTRRDRFYWTSPVKTYPANNYGLYDMAGNVWEWTADLYDANYYTKQLAQGLVVNPKNTEISFDPSEPAIRKYVLRGGSFLCNKNYCKGYRVSARMRNTPETAMVHVGFRCVKDS